MELRFLTNVRDSFFQERDGNSFSYGWICESVSQNYAVNYRCEDQPMERKEAVRSAMPYVQQPVEYVFTTEPIPKNGPVKLNKFEVDKFGALELQFSITESEKITVRLPVDSLSVKKEIKAGSDWFVQIITD